MPRASARTHTADPVRLAVVYRALDTIKPYPRNARRHTPAQISAIKRSMAEFGWTAPMLIADGQIIAGHARHRAASELIAAGGSIPGAPEPGTAPTIDLSHLPPDKRRAYVLADNRLAELADWDVELLRYELTELSGLGMDPAVIGYSPAEFETLTAGWTADWDALNRLRGEASEHLGLFLVRCKREQMAAVEAALTQAIAGFEGVTVAAR
jgi:ParB-like chromosome segregation protein Spo0J